LADVPYGTHPKQVLDFYKAESVTPTPLVFYIHGGGWMNGSKAPFNAGIYGTPPALGQEQKDPTHSANFGVKLQEKCRSVGVECHLAYPGATDPQYRGIGEFLVAKLKGKETEKK